MTERPPIAANRKTAVHGPRGIECPSCGCKHLDVVYARPTEGGRIRRRRECRNCGRRITTYERSIG